MDKLFLIAMLVISSVLQAQNWQLVWSDEFDSTGLPNTSKWAFDTEGNNWDWGNSEAQNYTTADHNNAWVADGNLVIEARKEQYTWPGDNQTRDYTSARLYSIGQGNWLYGKIEVRAKLPTGKGMWPAIWLLPTDWAYGAWPKSGELDMMENVGYDPNRLNFNIHTESYNHTIGTNKGANALFNEPYNNYMLYTLQWFPDSVVFYVDNVKYFRFDRESSDYKVWPFNKAFHLLLNVTVGGSWGGIQGIDDLIFPQKMFVDYVRVYQQVSNDKFVINTTTTGGGFITKSTQDSVMMNSKVTLTATPDKSHQFAFWTGDILSAENPYELTVTGNTTVEGVFKHWCESVNNGDFAHDFNFWEYVKNDGATGNYTINNGQLTMNITNAGANLWSTSLVQQGFLVEKDKQYFLSFDARATANRTIKAGLGMNHDPWATYIYETVNLTTTTQHFNLPFTMTQATDAVARMVFDMGQNVEDVTFDNISLSCMDLTTVIQTKNNSAFDFNAIQKDNQIQVILMNEPVENTMDISLFDLAGRCIKPMETSKLSNQLSIPIDDVANGMYIISVKSNGWIMNKKIEIIK